MKPLGASRWADVGKNRRRVLILAAALVVVPPGLLITGYMFQYLREASEIAIGTSPAIKQSIRSLLNRELIRWGLREILVKKNLPLPHEGTLAKPLSETMRQELEGISNRIEQGADADKKAIRERELDAWADRILRSSENAPPELTNLMEQGEAEAKRALVSRLRRECLGTTLALLPVTGTLSLGCLLAALILKPERVRHRFRMTIQVALAGWTVFLALMVGFADLRPGMVQTVLVQTIALWVAGLVPCVLLLYWTRDVERIKSESSS